VRACIHAWWGSCVKLRFQNSLRARYAAVSLILMLLVLAGAFVAHESVRGVRSSTSSNIETRNQVLHISRQIRDSVWHVRHSLEAFLLDPDDPGHRAQMHAAIELGISRIDRLLDSSWIADYGQTETLRELRGSLRALSAAAGHLIETRIDASRQYPGIAVGRAKMLPQHIRFRTAAAQALEEIHAEGPRAWSDTAFQAVVRARDSWTEMTSMFRMYLANRLASLDEGALTQQEQDIEIRLRDLMQNLDGLEALRRQGGLGFQSELALSAMFEAVGEWEEGYKEVKRINAGDNWRTDTAIMQQNIAPLLDQLWGLLLSLDLALERSGAQDVQHLNGLAANQSRLVWLLTTLAVGFILLGFIALERWILRPIATVADALKHEATGGGPPRTLPRSTSDETRNLVDAFVEMRNQVRSRQVALEHQAMHDALTGLPNRTLLLDRLQQAIYVARRDRAPLTLMMMDLDRFKEINDTLGHQVGDRLLQEVGRRLAGTVRKSDTVARLGGDEFAMVLPGTDPEQACLIAAAVNGALERVVRLDNHHLYVRASIGMAAFPEHGTHAQTLIQRADVAMYIAKRTQSSQAVYDPRQDQHSVGRLALVSDLRRAIDTGALALHYQPKVEMDSGRVVGAEALLRWNHPVHGSVAPGELVALAEQTGLIHPLTHWVLERAVSDCARWRARFPDVGVAVNLSVHNLQDAGLVDQIAACLDRHRLPSQHLALELTESAMMADAEHGVRLLSELDAMGVHLAVDDFGTGFSSLAYLKQLPVDALKIDKSFVLQMCEHENDAVIVRSTIDLAHNLGLRVVAEGVENGDIWNLLEILGCDQAQGFHLCRPRPLSEFLDWLAERRSGAPCVQPLRA